MYPHSSPSFCSASELELASALLWDLLTTPLTKALLRPLERPTMACIPVTSPHLMVTITRGLRSLERCDVLCYYMFLVSLVTFYCAILSLLDVLHSSQLGLCLQAFIIRSDLSRPWPNVQTLLSLSRSLRFKTGFLKHEQLLSDAQQKLWWLISSMTYGFTAAAKTARHRRLLNIV